MTTTTRSVKNCNTEKEDARLMGCVMRLHESWKRNGRECHCDMCGAVRPAGMAAKMWCKAHKHLVFRCCTDSTVFIEANRQQESE